MDYYYRHTKIIFTISLAIESEEMLESLLKQRVDICRLNMAHASHEWTLSTIKRIRKVSERGGDAISLPIIIGCKGSRNSYRYLRGPMGT